MAESMDDMLKRFKSRGRRLAAQTLTDAAKVVEPKTKSAPPKKEGE